MTRSDIGASSTVESQEVRGAKSESPAIQLHLIQLSAGEEVRGIRRFSIPVSRSG